jgi:S-formylglutathione hydrolase FrmB
MKDIDSVEQFIVNELPRILPIINTDKISIIGHSKGGVSALLYCTQYNTKIAKVCTWRVRLIFIAVGIQNLFTSGDPRVFSISKMRELIK